MVTTCPASEPVGEMAPAPSESGFPHCAMSRACSAMGLAPVRYCGSPAKRWGDCNPSRFHGHVVLAILLGPMSPRIAVPQIRGGHIARCNNAKCSRLSRQGTLAQIGRYATSGGSTSARTRLRKVRVFSSNLRAQNRVKLRKKTGVIWWSEETVEYFGQKASKCDLIVAGVRAGRVPR
jgi:hypothetical protein